MHYLDQLKRRIGRPEAVLECADILQAIYRDRACLGQLFTDYFRAVADPRSKRPSPVSRNVFAIVQPDAAAPPQRQFSLAMTVHEAGEAETVADQQLYTLLLPMNEAVGVEHFLIDEGWDPDVFSPEVGITPAGESVVAPGEVLGLAPGRATCHFRFRAGTVLLKLQSSLVTEVEWSFDVRTRRAWQCVSGVLAHTNAELSCDRARALRDAQAIPALRGLLGHGRHNVRWAAARAIAAIDRAEGEVALRVLSADPHPHVVSAARKALAAWH